MVSSRGSNADISSLSSSLVGVLGMLPSASSLSRRLLRLFCFLAERLPSSARLAYFFPLENSYEHFLHLCIRNQISFPSLYLHYLVLKAGVENIDLAPRALEKYLPLGRIFSNPETLQTRHQIIRAWTRANKLCNFLMLHFLLAVTRAVESPEVL